MLNIYLIVSADTFLIGGNLLLLASNNDGSSMIISDELLASLMT